MPVVLLDVLRLVGGVVLLVAGATALVQGGSALAKRMGISPLWVGLTIVAFGTSAPELVVSAIASSEGSGGVAIGNVVGSNILNVLVVLGVTALWIPVAVQRVTVRRDITLLFGISLATLAIAADGTLHWAEGSLLLLGVVPYTLHVYREEKRGWMPVPEPPTTMDRQAAWVQLAAVLAGVAVLVVGGRLVVDGGAGVSVALGVPDRIVGLTFIAIGTSLPELATSLVAVFRKQVDLALGNIIGSNILNLLLVLGTAALVRPIAVDGLLLGLDLPLMVAVTMLLWRFASTRQRITRTEGGLLLGVYLFYLGYLLGTSLA